MIIFKDEEATIIQRNFSLKNQMDHQLKHQYKTMKCI